MATIVSNQVLESREEYGAMQFLRLRYLVTGVSGSGGASSLQAALTDAGVPAYGVRSTTFPNLYCVNRSARLAPGAKDVFEVDVELVSSSQLEAGWIFHFSTAQQNYETQRDGNGFPITVQYQFPNDHWDSDLAGVLLTQGATINVLRPAYEAYATGIVDTEFPLSVQEKYFLHVNSTEWFGAQPGEWMCASIISDPHDLSTEPRKYKFQVRFQHKRGGWQPMVYFQHQGEIPPDLIPGIGYKSVYWYAGADFNEMWPSPRVLPE